MKPKYKFFAAAEKSCQELATLGEGQCAQEHYWRNAAFSHFQELQAGHRIDRSTAFGVSYKCFFGRSTNLMHLGANIQKPNS
jgi:hypothetical protein